jgi:hypothetical protein
MFSKAVQAEFYGKLKVGLDHGQTSAYDTAPVHVANKPTALIQVLQWLLMH